jgi:Flp pilus assembly protein TadD
MTKERTPLRALGELLRALDARIERHPNYPDLRNLRGLARTYNGDHDGAFADLVEALRLHSQYEAALVNMAWLHAERREPDLVRAVLREPRGRRLRPGLRVHLQVLEAQVRDGAEAALGVLDAYAAQPRPEPDPWHELDRLWLAVQLERWDMVDAQVRRLVAQQAAIGPILHQVGLVGRGSAGRAALATWNQCYRGNPQVAALLRECARLRAAGAAFSDCEDILRWSAVLSLDLCDFWLVVGEQHDFEARDADAESAFRQAMQFDSRRAQPYIKLGQLYAACGRPQEAIRELQHAATLRRCALPARLVARGSWPAAGGRRPLAHGTGHQHALHVGAVVARISPGHAGPLARCRETIGAGARRGPGVQRSRDPTG